MVDSMNDILHPGREADSGFPHAPAGWSPTDSEAIANEEGLDLNEEYWEVVRALQELFARQRDISVRKIHDALNEKFYARGGMKHLYRLLPGGPVAQGCRLAGIKAPAGSTDASFGSVQ